MKDRNLYALILGVSSGFGRATAIELAKLGYNIIGVHLDMGTNKKKAEEFCASLELLGAKAIFYNANAADETRRKELIQKILSRVVLEYNFNPTKELKESLKKNDFKLMTFSQVIEDISKASEKDLWVNG